MINTRRNFLLLAAALPIAACGLLPGGVTPQSVVDWIKTNCNGIVVTLGDIAAVITANPGAASSAAVIGGFICSAINAQRAAQAQASTQGIAPPTSGVVDINGVPVHWSKQ
jgi:hypothetical protein